jgi:hypothetical protein
MVTKNDIHRAMALVRDSTKNLDVPMTSLNKQLFLALCLYKQRGEFDGSYESAIQCLAMAGYEIEG